MADATVFVNDLFDEDITVDNETFPWVHAISIEAKINTARKVTIQFSTREGLEMCSIGRTLRVQVGKSDVAGGIDFIGKIKMVIPSYEVSTAIAYDYIADLNSSKLVNFLDRDYAGMDLLMAAKHGINNSVGNNKYIVDAMSHINLDALNLSCGVKYKKNQGFEGYQTRKSFLNKIFAEASTEMSIQQYLSGAYPILTFLPWYYAIRKNNELEVFRPDIYTENPVMHLGRNNFNVIGTGLTGTIDTARMVNSVVVQSSETDYIATYSDDSSIAQYGSQSLLMNSKISNPSKMDEIAYTVVTSGKEPAGSYTVIVDNAHWVDLGNVVEVTLPTMEERRKFVVKEYKTIIKDAVITTLTLGSNKLRATDLIKRVSNK